MPHLPASLNIVLHCCVANLFRFIPALVLSRVLGTLAAELKNGKKQNKRRHRWCHLIRATALVRLAGLAEPTSKNFALLL